MKWNEVCKDMTTRKPKRDSIRCYKRDGFAGSYVPIRQFKKNGKTVNAMVIFADGHEFVDIRDDAPGFVFSGYRKV